ncbi:Vacuolar protein sorting-associated protein isoform 1 [Schistosoma japonicum]|uniref:Vacuolar protein sorting-associated protein 26B n=1 Tax=Schistosoma japonicum TaxID=6182 RepID=C1LH13_SCHJA|nr:Vacuolar protein sorting-associated protein isoform 1 [Schistosoma japonicum]CAX73991.1 Vacuolar protein sorting-associated protein 26B [Schistosoma japonicum]
MLSFLGLGQNVDIKVNLLDEEHRRKEEQRSEDGRIHSLPVYYDGENVCGSVNVGLKRGGKLEHQGIKIEFIGQIELYTDRGNREEFVSLCQDLARPGILSHSTSYPFEFLRIEKPYESYCGTNVRLRYFLRVTIQKRIADITKEFELVVHSTLRCSESSDNIQMEVGIEDSLHIEFEYNKSKYHLQDVIIGKIYFLLVRVKIKNMEIQILKRETIGAGATAFSEMETVGKYEIMDGAPVRGESIPIRLFLHVYGLSPTMRDVHRRFSVRYFLNLVLLDEEDRRYYKQQEIILYRKPDRRFKAYVQQQITDKGLETNENGVKEKHEACVDNKLYEQADLKAPGKGPESSSLCSDLANDKYEDDNMNSSKFIDSNPTGSECNISKLTNGEEDSDSGDSFSPQTRTARSMHRYESKQAHKRTESPTICNLPNESPVLSSSVSSTQNSK